jgi:hypothetical protein
MGGRVAKLSDDQRTTCMPIMAEVPYLRIGQNSIRLDSGTNFQFVNLSDNVVQTSINSGSLRLRHLLDTESWEVDTPNGALTVLRARQPTRKTILILSYLRLIKGVRLVVVKDGPHCITWAHATK